MMPSTNSQATPSYWAYDYLMYGYIPSRLWHQSQPDTDLTDSTHPAATATESEVTPAQFLQDEPETQQAGLLGQCTALALILIGSVTLSMGLEKLTQSIEVTTQNLSAEVGILRASSFKF